MRKLLALSLASTALTAVAAPLVSNVTMTQGGGTVTIGYTLSEEPGIVTLDIQTNAAENVWVSVKGESLTYLDGDVNKRVGIGAHAITWKARKALPFDKISKDVRAVVTARSLSEPPDYMVASLTNANDVSFYVDAASVPYGVTNDMYKTDYLVMRKCPAANVAWRMGSPTDEDGHKASENPHIVTLSDDFYIGVYEVTQRQYELMMSKVAGVNARPSLYANEQCYATRPVERVTYEMIRGAAPDYDWPNTGHSVDPNSFIGQVRAITGLAEIDLPLDAQWEYACRAGSGRSMYTYADGSAIALDDIGRHRMNGGYIPPEYSFPSTDCTTENGTAAVGSYVPNVWGIYDMIGNLREWCRDWYVEELSGVNPEMGPSEGTNRVIRGGSYVHTSNNNRCAERLEYHADHFVGFRLASPAVIQ